jgi:hypothetical protein
MRALIIGGVVVLALAHAWVWLALAVLAAAGWWLLRLRLHPYGRCRRCRSRPGRNIGSSAEAYGRCGACGGTGERIRTGARSVNPNLKEK